MYLKERLSSAKESPALRKRTRFPQERVLIVSRNTAVVEYQGEYRLERVDAVAGYNKFMQARSVQSSSLPREPWMPVGADDISVNAYANAYKAQGQTGW